MNGDSARSGIFTGNSVVRFMLHDAFLVSLVLCLNFEDVVRSCHFTDRYEDFCFACNYSDICSRFWWSRALKHISGPAVGYTRTSRQVI